MSDAIIEVSANVATQLIQDTLSGLYTPLSSLITVKKAQFIEKFTAHCQLTHNKCNQVRTLYSKNKSVPLSDVYVRTAFTQSNRKFSDRDLINKFASGDRIIIKGNGGSGKTIFLKHLWISRFSSKASKVPIFVELRRLNDLNSPDLSAFCRGELQADMSFGKGVFDKLCEAGKFEFIFDGFDEVSRENRKTVERQIISMAEKHPKCNFLVSGREDDRFSSWVDFETFSVAPLELNDVKELIEKIPFDRKVKRKFLSVLKEDFYTQHRSFLSSPLLAVMMLMTFNENAIIPSKLTEFYKSAFQTLLTWHDATKDSFERDRCLTVDEFRKVFSTFCLITYYEQSYEFDEDSLRKAIGKSLQYHHLEKDIDDVKNDICESANLMQKDGLKFAFVHRSFQEYFAAECAMQVVSGKANEFLTAFSKRLRDSVFSMCYEIHSELVYDQFLAEMISDLRENRILNSHNPTLWPMNSWWIECINTSELGLRPMHATFDSDEEQQDFLHKIELIRQVTNDSNTMDIVHGVFEVLFRTVAETAAEANLPKGDAQALQITILFDEGTPKVKMRNTGRENYSTSQTRRFRSKFISTLKRNIKTTDEHLKRSYKNIFKLMAELELARACKEKSIDDILGI